MGWSLNKKIISSFKRYFWLFLVFIFLIFIIQSDLILYSVPEKVDEVVAKHFEVYGSATFFVQPYRSAFLNFIDEVNPFYYTRKSPYDHLPTYEIELSEADLEHFKVAAKESSESGYRSDLGDTWRSGDLVHEGESYPVKIKLHGNQGGNFQDFFKLSFNVKLKDDASIDGIVDLQFILPEQSGYDAKVFLNDLASQAGLDTLQGSYANVKVNGLYRGIYFVTEKVSPEFLERTQRSDAVLFAVSRYTSIDTKTDMEKGPTFITSPHVHPFARSTAMMEPLDSEHASEYLYAYHLLQNATSHNIDSMVNVDKWAAYEAVRTVYGDLHDSFSDNLRLAYITSSGLFEPVFRSEKEVQPLDLYDDVSFEHSLNGFASNTLYSPLLNAVNTNDEIRHQRNLILYDFVMNKDDLISHYHAVQNEYLDILMHDRSPFASREIRYFSEYSVRKFKDNLRIVESVLDKSRLYIDVHIGNDASIILTPDSNSAIKFSYFGVNFSLPESYDGEFIVESFKRDGSSINTTFHLSKSVDITSAMNEIYIQYTFDDEMRVIYPKIRYDLHLPPNVFLENISYSAFNSVTNKLLNDSDIRVAKISSDSFIKSTLLRESIFSGSFADSVYVVEKGDYVVSDSMVILSDVPIVFQAGSSITLQDGVSILFKSSVNFDGTKTNPIVIRSQNGTYGAFAISSQEDCSINANYLDVSGGFESVVNGVFYSGAFSIYDCDLLLNNSRIHSNNADDGLNVKRGRVTIDNSYFFNNFADQIDLDFCDATVQNSFFFDGGLDSNGDGLDFSSSFAIVENSSFIDFSDKGLSIGENSHVIIRNNYFENNGFGAAVKDSSLTYFEANDFINNTYAITAYQKKPIFGGGTVLLQNNYYNSFQSPFHSDSLSEFFNINSSFSDFDQINLRTKVDTALIDTVFDSPNGGFYSFSYDADPVEKIKTFFPENYVYNRTNMTSKFYFFETSNERISSHDSCYYLRSDSSSDLTIANELFFIFPDGGSGFFQTEELSPSRSFLDLIKYSVSSDNNELIQFMNKEIDLSEKLGLQKEFSFDTQIYEIIDPVSGEDVAEVVVFENSGLYFLLVYVTPDFADLFVKPDLSTTSFC